MISIFNDNVFVRPDDLLLRITVSLFYFQSVRHGFPNKPTALAWDPELKILAIGTKQGLLRV